MVQERDNTQGITADVCFVSTPKFCIPSSCHFIACLPLECMFLFQGVLPNGTAIAAKRMDPDLLSTKGLAEFQVRGGGRSFGYGESSLHRSG